jgi:transcriptional regulator with XRE-family HTH domain
MTTETKTFRAIYDALDPVPPKTKWVQRIAKATMRSENAVRMWLNGRQTPEPLVQNIIAKELGVPVEGLFPTKTAQQNEH